MKHLKLLLVAFGACSIVLFPATYHASAQSPIFAPQGINNQIIQFPSYAPFNESPNFQTAQFFDPVPAFSNFDRPCSCRCSSFNGNGRDPFTRDPFFRDPFRDPFGRDPFGRNPFQDPFGREQFPQSVF
jgi:hypothetical protein